MSQYVFGGVERGIYEKGAIAGVFADGVFLGNKVIPPDFVVVHVPGDTVQGGRQAYLVPWPTEIEWSEIAAQTTPPNDGWRFTVGTKVENLAPDGSNKVSLAKLEPSILDWNGIIRASGDNYVTFDIGVYEGMTSKGVFRVPVNDVIFAQMAYVEATGYHEISGDYGAKNWPENRVVEAIEGTGADLLSISGKVAHYQIGRDLFKSRTLPILEQEWRRQPGLAVNFRSWRWRLNPAEIDRIIAEEAGVTTKTRLELDGLMEDRMGILGL